MILNCCQCYSVSRDGAVFVWNCERKLKDFEEEDSKRKITDESSGANLNF